MVFAIQFVLACIVGFVLYLEHRNYRKKSKKNR